MRKKVVFFIFSISPREVKRVKEFLENGYDVKVYSIEKKDSIKKKNIDYEVETMNFDTEISYFRRLLRYTPKLIRTINQYDKKNTLFYFFTLNVAIPTVIISNIEYVYEESDMLFDNVDFFLYRLLIKCLNKFIIKKALITVFTSEGFSRYYFGNNKPNNIVIIPNRVNKECLQLPKLDKGILNINRIKFGFVGYLRSESIYNFAKTLVENFSEHEFHFFGENIYFSEEQIQALINNEKRVFFHGSFNNPTDLPLIYSKIDFVVGTYDSRRVNPRYAEPNKFYEAIFFETPIIVSNNTFLADKVDNMNIGFSVNPWNKNDIVERINSVNLRDYNNYIKNLRSIPKEDVINKNKSFFSHLEKTLKHE